VSADDARTLTALTSTEVRAEVRRRIALGTGDYGVAAALALNVELVRRFCCEVRAGRISTVVQDKA
jgi:hypothetical protein